MIHGFSHGSGVNSSLTAAVVVLTGLIGANFVQAAMDKLGLNDPIARGLGTASRYVFGRNVSDKLVRLRLLCKHDKDSGPACHVTLLG
jgi:hypothetical protein